MPWVNFVKDFNYRKPSFTIAYKAGMVLNVKTDCAEEAIAKGRAKPVKTPRKGEVVRHGDQSQDTGA